MADTGATAATSGTAEFELLGERGVSAVMEGVPNDPQQTPMSEELALLAALQRDIAERLKPVCSAMDDLLFEELVRDIAAMKIKYGAESDLSGALRTELNVVIDPDCGTSI